MKNSQTFWIEKSQSQIDKVSQNIFTIKQSKNSKKYLYVDDNDAIKCQQGVLWKDQCNKWKLSVIVSHPLINQTCLIENYHSGLFLEVYQSRQSEGQKLVQNVLHNQFNQRWQIVQKDQYFIIKSLKTGLVVDVKGQRSKQGTSIIQWPFKDSLNQRWALERHGKRMYIIRSLLDKKLMLAVRGNSLKDQTQVVLSKNEAESFWRIIGNIDI